MNKKRTAVVLCFMLVSVIMHAQSAVRFPLERHDDGHFYFSANIYGENAEIMLESGIPALLVGQDFYERRMKNCGLNFEPSQSKTRLLNSLYEISCKADGKVKIGKTIYDGPIFILEGFDGISLPIQHLKDPATGRRIVCIDLEEHVMTVGGTPGRQGKKYKLAFDSQTGRPYINAAFTIDGFKFDGKLLVDFGNPMFMFLFKQHRCVHNAVVKGAIELQSAYNARGELVSQGFIAGKVDMYGQTFNDVIIGVTDKYRNAKELGFLGIPFFDAPVEFDFDNCFMYKNLTVSRLTRETVKTL